MRPRDTTELLDRLTDLTLRNQVAAENFALMDDETLRQRPNDGGWNALECLAHLNYFSEWYLAEMRRRIEGSKFKGAQPTFTTSWLGNKFAAGMKPGADIKTFTAPKKSNPSNFKKPVKRDVIATFLAYQEDTLDVLRLAADVDLTRTKTSTMLPFIKLRLGDTLRTVIYHNWRHVVQAERAVGTESVHV